MKKIILFVAVVAMAACNTPQGNKEANLDNFGDSASYAIGTSIGLNLVGDFKAQGIDTSMNMDLVIAGLSDAITVEDSSKLSKEQAQELVTRFFDNLNAERANSNASGGLEFLAENGSKPGVVTTASGLQYIVLKQGEGANATVADQVRVHYTGKLLNGTVFDSSIERNEPVDFFVRSVIPGWTEALQLMNPGSSFKLFIPSELAYGEQGNPRGGIGPNEVLVFDVKLIDILPQQ
ncbi:MAG: FKBP-type peptidyl-prolyl cis-trans isomerase [Flavobacteriales bacterium]